MTTLVSSHKDLDQRFDKCRKRKQMRDRILCHTRVERKTIYRYNWVWFYKLEKIFFIKSTYLSRKSLCFIRLNFLVECFQSEVSHAVGHYFESPSRINKGNYSRDE